mmetsp:Transcript_47705/g.97072  ORF Transcript_47705/g.97072 Transcript_47705/m.97072 type:complete len:206 (+) Transcript_47705:291-908(+)
MATPQQQTAHRQLVTAPGSLLAVQRVHHPIQPVVDPVAGGGTAALDEPLVVLQRMQVDAVRKLRWRQGVRVVLLVRHDQNLGVLQLWLGKHAVKLLLDIGHALGAVVRRVDHEDQPVSAGVVVAPQLADLLLSSDIPARELHVAVLDTLHVEADGGHGGDDLPKLQLVQERRLASIVKAKHQNLGFLLPEAQAIEQRTDGDAHGG